MNTGKNVRQLCKDAAGTGVQTPPGETLAFVTYQLGLDVSGSAQVSISATATVAIEGRIDPLAPWVPLGSTSTAGFLNLTRVMPQMRANISANTGTVSVWVMA